MLQILSAEKSILTAAAKFVCQQRAPGFERQRKIRFVVDRCRQQRRAGLQFQAHHPGALKNHAAFAVEVAFDADVWNGNVFSGFERRAVFHAQLPRALPALGETRDFAARPVASHDFANALSINVDWLDGFGWQREDQFVERVVQDDDAHVRANGHLALARQDVSQAFIFAARKPLSEIQFEFRRR